eukprot:Mrub_02909.p1 GENE.Mrub_02909~~Mrub_02909.p1  ORF type:complete len:463 (+),score=77.94 Mrub_02909:73-1389(+)
MDKEILDLTNLSQASIFKNNDLFEYIQKCKQLEIKSDPSISNVLASNFHILQPSIGSSYQAKLLPLIEILKRNTYITKIKLPQFKKSICFCFDNFENQDFSGNSDANLLGLILKDNKSIKELDISYHNIGIEGLKSLCHGVINNKTLEKIDLSGNYIGEKSVPILKSMIENNNNLTSLTIENMNIEYSGIQQLRSSAISKTKPLELIVNGNFVYEERLNVYTHLIGLVLSLYYLSLLYYSIEPGNTTQMISRLTFGMSSVILYTASCLFHATHQSSQFWKTVFKSTDHICIFFLIAGSYTPFMIEGIGLDNPKSTVLFLVEWGFVFFGMMMNISFRNYYPAVLLELFLYLAMGWGIAFIFADITPKMTGNGMTYLVGGGLCFTVGVVFFKLGEYIPIYHVLWHIFVVFGSVFIFQAVFYNMDVGGGLSMSDMRHNKNL